MKENSRLRPGPQTGRGPRFFDRDTPFFGRKNTVFAETGDGTMCSHIPSSPGHKKRGIWRNRVES